MHQVIEAIHRGLPQLIRMQIRAAELEKEQLEAKQRPRAGAEHEAARRAAAAPESVGPELADGVLAPGRGPLRAVRTAAPRAAS